jgi:hypothetical protein
LELTDKLIETSLKEFYPILLKDVKFIILVRETLGKLRMKKNLAIVQFVSVLLKMKVSFPLGLR